MEWFGIISLLVFAVLFGKNGEANKNLQNKMHYTEEQKKKILERANEIENEDFKKYIVSLNDKEKLSDDDYFCLAFTMFLLENLPSKKEENKTEEK